MIPNPQVGKYFQIKAEDHDIVFSRREENLARDAAINGIYVIRTSVPIENLSSEKAVLTYKRLAKVEWAFRTMKSVDLQVRPIHHHLENRVKAHMFICMLAYYEGPVSASRRRTGQQRSSLLDRREWHLRSAWGELMFADEEGSVRETTVSPVRASASGREKKAKAHNREGLPLQTFHGMIKSLATMSRIQIRMGQDGPTCTRITKPTPLQARALELIDAAAV